MTDPKLKSLAERIERLMDERDGIQSDIRDIYTEAKGVGYVPKVLRKAITRKRMDPSKRDEEDSILELYEGALSAPLRKAAAMAKAGATSREIEQETGIDHATVARSVALNKKSATRQSAKLTVISPPEVESLPPPPVEMGAEPSSAEHAPPSQGDSGECLSGRVLSSDEHSTPAVLRENAAPDGRVDGGHIAVPPMNTPQAGEADTLPVTPVPDEGVGAGTLCRECGEPWHGGDCAPVPDVKPRELTPVELGAVAEPSAAQRVADPDDLKIPAFLRGSAR